MKITARLQNRQGQHQVRVSTNENIQSLTILPKLSSAGSMRFPTPLTLSPMTL